MNYKIVLSKTTNALFLATVLIAGTIALSFSLSSSSFITADAQAQPYYDGMDRYDDRKSYDKRSYGNHNGYYESQYQPSYKPDYKPKYPSYDGKDDRRDKSKDSSKSVSLNKIKCINTNLNINGNNAGNVSIGNKGGLTEEGYLGAYSSAGGYGSEGYYNDGYNNNKKDVGFDCIINNNNNNVVAGGGNVTTPEPSKATLNVTKNVTCTYETGGVNPVLACLQLEERITENQFLIQVTDGNPVPSQFPGSESGTIVTLGAGNYVVSETLDAAAIQADIDYLVQQFESSSGATDYTISYPPQVSFTGDCTDVNPNNPRSTEATGTIGAGESQTCEIENHFVINALLP
ncbi:MAG TPA: hypothetical protein VFM28_07160 [Nitrososphaeraceae archaeon]|nr:hypothetical protein [Nitrososphaeraceae archaeon]